MYRGVVLTSFTGIQEIDVLLISLYEEQEWCQKVIVWNLDQPPKDVHELIAKMKDRQAKIDDLTSKLIEVGQILNRFDSTQLSGTPNDA